MPPTVVSVAASTRNCQRISRRFAPRAFRTPISRVRSVTDTIMMAMTPMPPTRSATLERRIMVRKNTPVSWLKMLSTWSDVSMSNVLGSPGRRPRIRRNCMVAASIATSTETVSLGLTRMMSAFVSSYRYERRAVSNGTMAAISCPGG